MAPDLALVAFSPSPPLAEAGSRLGGHRLEADVLALPGWMAMATSIKVTIRQSVRESRGRLFAMHTSVQRIESAPHNLSDDPC